jgi:hypothetical protein
VSDHPFGQWLDSDRTGPVPEPVPAPGSATGQYWLTADDTHVHLWCHLCTAGGDDYLGEWGTPTPPEYEAEATARIREHLRDKHSTQLDSQGQ